jgi:fructoselysine 6-kinase
MKVAAVGFCCMDIYKELDRCYPTGNGVDFAMNLSKLGIQASIVSVVGDDANGATAALGRLFRPLAVSCPKFMCA